MRHWLGAEPELPDARAAYALLVGRWLRTFGPGTEEDIVWWFGATKTAVRAALTQTTRHTSSTASAMPCRRIVGGWSQDPAGEVRIMLREKLPRHHLDLVEEARQRLIAFVDGDRVPSTYAVALLAGRRLP